MNPTDLLLALFEERAKQKPRPISHWDNHCVNCGVLAGNPHVADDCPPQHYERSKHEL